MKRYLCLACLSFVLLGPVSASAQSCAAVVSEMASKFTNQGLKTSLTWISHQSNGLSSYSGANYEARLVWDGSRMSTKSTGGGKGQLQFSDRYSSAATPAGCGLYVQCSPRQNYATSGMEPVDVYLTAYLIEIYDNAWGNSMRIYNPICQNGVIWGFGDPVGNNNGANKALYVFSYAYASR